MSFYVSLCKSNIHIMKLCIVLLYLLNWECWIIIGILHEFVSTLDLAVWGEFLWGGFHATLKCKRDFWDEGKITCYNVLFYREQHVLHKFQSACKILELLTLLFTANWQNHAIFLVLGWNTLWNNRYYQNFVLKTYYSF